MSERKYWKISYLPAPSSAKEVGWEFYGTEQELGDYLFEKHSCFCSDCRGKPWWSTAQSAEYLVEEILEDELPNNQ